MRLYVAAIFSIIQQQIKLEKVKEFFGSQYNTHMEQLGFRVSSAPSKTNVLTRLAIAF